MLGNLDLFYRYINVYMYICIYTYMREPLKAKYTIACIVYIQQTMKKLLKRVKIEDEGKHLTC